jgi:hypothetical protein
MASPYCKRCTNVFNTENTPKPILIMTYLFYEDGRSTRGNIIREAKGIKESEDRWPESPSDGKMESNVQNSLSWP